MTDHAHELRRYALEQARMNGMGAQPAPGAKGE